MIRNAAANVAPDMRNAVTFPAANARLRNSPIGTSGASARRCHQTNATSSAHPASSVPTVCGLDQPASLTRTKAQTRRRPRW